MLLPCPFCGVKPFEGKHRKPAVAIHLSNGCSLGGMKFSIQLWNTRTPASQVEAGEVERDAFHEALRRYPDAHGALVFFWVAAGLAATAPTAEQIEWADAAIARKEQP